METCSHSGRDRATARPRTGRSRATRRSRRRRVLDATLALADKGGFDAVQMRDVAAEAGVALGTVYRYFSSKERLLLEANVGQVEALGAGLLDRPPTGETAADRVVDVLRRACNVLVKRPEATAAMVRALGSAQPNEADAVRRVSQAMTAIITGAMHEGDPTERDRAVARVLSQVWLSSLDRLGRRGRRPRGGRRRPRARHPDADLSADRPPGDGQRSRTCSSVPVHGVTSCITTSPTCSRRSSTCIPDRTALVVGDTRRTFAEIEDRVEPARPPPARRRGRRGRPRAASTPTTAPSGSRG